MGRIKLDGQKYIYAINASFIKFIIFSIWLRKGKFKWVFIIEVVVKVGGVVDIIILRGVPFDEQVVNKYYKGRIFFRTYLHFFAVTGQMHQEKETVGSYQVEAC